MCLTNEVFHHLRVVSMKDGCSKPAQVELDVSLSCFDVFLVAYIHRLSPVSRQRNANKTCRCKTAPLSTKIGNELTCYFQGV